MSSDPEDPGGSSTSIEIADEQNEAVDLSSVTSIATHALGVLGLQGELSIAFVTPERISELKGSYYGEAAPTDVLSFSLDPPLIGEVVICPAFAKRQARALGRSLNDELRQLVVHGILHLSGADHAIPQDEIAMAVRERNILESA
ncbi:MAG: rRNA maturation RNase YbeY [Actinomycetota bacterium]